MSADRHSNTDNETDPGAVAATDTGTGTVIGTVTGSGDPIRQVATDFGELITADPARVLDHIDPHADPHVDPHADPDGDPHVDPDSVPAATATPMAQPQPGPSERTRRLVIAQALADRGHFSDALLAAESLIGTQGPEELGSDAACEPIPPLDGPGVAALVLKASIQRQLGRHDLARACDGAALAAARSIPDRHESSDSGSTPWSRAVVTAMAYQGLAADAVGAADARRAAAFLASADAAAIQAPWWLRVRREWVATEVHLIAGTDAEASAATALGLCEEATGDPVRYLAKSHLFAAIAADVAGAPDRDAHAVAALDLAQRYGLAPLLWPVAAARARWAEQSGDAEAQRHFTDLAARTIRNVLDASPRGLGADFAATSAVRAVVAP